MVQLNQMLEWTIAGSPSSLLCVTWFKRVSVMKIDGLPVIGVGESEEITVAGLVVRKPAA